MITVQFLGAAGTVTGSKFAVPLLEEKPRLLEFFRTYSERVKRERRRQDGEV